MKEVITTVALGVVVALGLAAAGCGTGSKPLTEKEYASELATICARVNAKEDAFDVDRELTTSEVSALNVGLLDELDKAFSKLKKLRPPDTLKAIANRWVSLVQRERALLVAIGGENDEAKKQKLQADHAAVDKEGDRLAKKLGAPACAAGYYF